MPRTVSFNGVTHSFPDDATDDEIAAALSSEPQQQPTPTEKKAVSLTERAASAAPAVGGLIGGLVPSVFRPASAALGGAAGQGYGELIRHAGELPGAIADVARNAVSQPKAVFQGFLQGAGEGADAAVKQAALQGTMEAAGPVVGKGLKATGKGIYAGGIALLPKGLKVEFPRMAQAGYDAGIALSAKGAEKAKALAGQIGQQVSDKLALLDRAGVPKIQPSEVAKSLRPVRDTLQKRAALGLPSEVPQLAGRAKAFGTANKGGMTLTRAQALKREAQDMADTAFRTQERGGVIKSDEMLANRAMAKGLKQAIENRAPDVRAMNEQLQSLIGLEQGAEHASNTGHVLSRLGGAGVLGGLGFGAGPVPALAAAGAGLAMTTPQGLARTGLALKSLGSAASSPVTANLLRAALLAQLSAEQ